MSGLAIAAGTTAAIGGAEFISGLEAKKKEERKLRNLHDPFYNIQNEFYQNKNIAEQESGQGLPTATRNYETQEAQRGLGTSLGDILKSGGDVNAASMLLSGYNNNIGKIGSADAEQHLNNLQYFMKANSDLAAEKEKQWSINELQPYEAKLKELKQNVQTDQSNEMQGLTTVGSAVSSYATGNSNASLIKKLMNSGNQQPGLASWSSPQLANPNGTAPSPAAGIGRINPNTLPDLGQNSDYTDPDS